MGDGACKNEQPAVKFSCLCDLDRPISTEKDGGDRGTGQGGVSSAQSLQTLVRVGGTID